MMMSIVISLPEYDWSEIDRHHDEPNVTKFFRHSNGNSCPTRLVSAVYRQTKEDMVCKYGTAIATHINVSKHVENVLNMLGYTYRPLLSIPMTDAMYHAAHDALIIYTKSGKYDPLDSKTGVLKCSSSSSCTSV